MNKPLSGRTASSIDGNGEQENDDAKYRICLNCGTELIGDLCYDCGQSAFTSRYSSTVFLHELYLQLSKIGGFETFRTFWSLLKRGGRFSRDYLDGQRVGWTPPLRFFFYAFAVQIFVGYLATLVSGDEYFKTQLAKDFGSQIKDLIFAAFWGLIWWAGFRNSGLNYVENLIAAIYFEAEINFITMIIWAPISFFIRDHDTSGAVALVSHMVIYVSFFIFYTRHLFRENVRLLTLKQIVLMIIYIPLAMILAALIALITG